MVPMTYRVKVLRYLWYLSIDTNNFAFEVKAIRGLEHTHLESRDTGRRTPDAAQSYSKNWVPQLKTPMQIQ